MPTYDGVNLFGYAVKTRMIQNPSAAQINEFFGVTGTQSLYGGGRGRTFLIDGVLTAPDYPTLQTLIGQILSYDDGIGRVFYHPVYGTWGSVVFRKFEPGERIIWGCALPYKAQFDGLI